MTGIVMAILSMACCWLQVGIDPVPWLGGAKWPLLMALSLYYTLHRDMGLALIAAMLCGVLQDAQGDLHLGGSSLFFCVIVFFVARIRRVVIAESVVTALMFGAGAGVLMSVLQYLMLVSARIIAVSFGWALLHTVGTAVLGAISCLILFPLCRRMELYAGTVNPKEDVDGAARTV